MENWKAIQGFEGAYEVSDLGRLRSLARVPQSEVRARFGVSQSQVSRVINPRRWKDR